MLDPVEKWTQDFDNLKALPSPGWALSMASTVDSLVTGKLQVPTESGPMPIVFNKVVFSTSLVSMPSVPLAPAAAFNIATAWELAMLASVYPPTSPINPGSIATAKIKLIADITNLKADPSTRGFASALRSAFAFFGT